MLKLKINGGLLEFYIISFSVPFCQKNSRVKGQNECEEDGDGDLSHMAQEPGALVLKIVHVSPQPSYQWFLVNILTV